MFAEAGVPRSAIGEEHAPLLSTWHSPARVMSGQFYKVASERFNRQEYNAVDEIW